MDENLILSEIVKNLAFEIEAANQDNVLKWTTANGTPLHVKVRVRNKDEPRLIQRGAIPVPRIGISAPEKLRLISSDQTILSFNVYLEDTLENEPKRHQGLKIFNIGNCLGTYSDDEGPYLPGSSEQETSGTDNISYSDSVALNKEMATVLCSTNTVPDSQKDHKGFFGKCKPGGCLDPPFGEDNYAYDLTKSNPQETVRVELHKLQDTKETYEPGGCLAPPLNDDETPCSTPKAYKQQENLELNSDYSGAKNQVLTKKSSEASLRHKAVDKKAYRKEDDSKKLMGIYTRTSRENSLESKYSNSIITYPTDVSSSETLFEQSPYKKDSIISKNDEHVQRHDNPVSYYVPPKDVMRYKEDEGKYNKRLSSDKIDKSDMGTVHDMVMEDENISPKKIGLECTQNEDSNVIVGKEVSKDDAEGTQANISFEDISSCISGSTKDERYQNSLDEIFKLTDPRVIESNSNKKENSNILQITSLTENNEQSNKIIEHLDETLSKENVQRQPNTTMVKSPDIEIKDKFTPVRANYAFNKQISDSCSANNEQLTIQSIKQLSKDFAERTQADQSFKDIPALSSDSNKVEGYKNSLDEIIKSDPRAIESNVNKKEISNFILQPQVTSLTGNDDPRSPSNKNIEKFEETLKTENYQAQPDTPMFKRSDIEINKMLPPLNANYVSKNQISDSCISDTEQPPIESIKQLILDPEISQFSDSLSPLTDNSNLGVTNDKTDRVFIETPVPHASRNLSPATILSSPDKQSEATAETDNVSKMHSEDFLHKSSKQKLELHEKLNDLSPQRISSNENNEFDVSSEHSLDLNQEFSNVMETCSPKDKLSQKEKPVLSSESLSAMSTGNVIISKHVSVDNYTKVASECHEKRTSDILQKKPYTARDSMDIQHDDINKTFPLKLNTFPALSSDTSIKKHEEIQEIPENKYEYLKSQIKCERDSLAITHNDLDTQDIHKKLEVGITSSLVILPRKIDLQSEVSIDSKLLTKKDDLNTNSEKQENTIATVSEKYFLPIPAEKVTNVSSAINKTKLLDSIPKENETLKVSSRNSLPFEVRSTQATVVNDVDSFFTDQKPFKVDILKTAFQETENINTQYKTTDSFHRPANMISVRKESLDKVSKDLEKTVYEECINDSLHRTLPSTLKDLHTESKTSVSENQLDDNDLRTKITTNSKIVANLTSETITENTKDLYSNNNVHGKSSFSTLSCHVKDMGIANVNTTYNPTTQDLLTNNLYSEMTENKTVHEDSINDSLHRTLPSTLKGLHTESKTSVSENQLDNNYLRAKITTNGKIVANLTSETITENTKDLYSNNNVHGKSSLSTLSGHVKDMGIENVNTTYNPTIQDLLTNSNLYSEMTENAKYISESPETGRIDFSKIYDNLNVDPTNIVLPEHIQDLDSINTVRHLEEIDMRDLEEQLDAVAHGKLNTDADFVPTILRKVELPTQITDSNNYVVVDKNEFLDPHGNELHEKINKLDVDINNSKYNENIERIQYKSESLSSKTELNEGQYFKDNDNRDLEKIEIILKNKSPSGEYLSPLGEIFSNISKKEEENSKQTGGNNLDESGIHEAFSKIDTKSREQKLFDNNFESTIREQRSTGIMSAKSDNGNNVMGISSDVPSNSIIKSSIQSLKLNYRQKETIPEVEHTNEKTTNVDESSQQFDDSLLNIAGDVTFVDNSTYKSGQPIKYNFSTIPASIHDVNVLNKDIFRRNSSKPFTYNKQPRAIKLKENKESNLVETESMPTQNDINPLYLNMSFYSYVNGNNQRVVETQSPITNQQNPNSGTVTVVKTLIRYGNEIRIPVDNENDITLNIWDKDEKAERNGSFVGSPTRRTLRAKHVLERSNRNDEVLNKNLAFIYESELIPLHSVIKDLTQEVNSLAAKQEILQTRLRNTKRTKSLRVIPIVKRCGCRRI